MATAAEREAVAALGRMSPLQRAVQLFTGTITNAANAATFGGVGALGDIARGTPWGTTGEQISAQVRAASPFAQAASSGIGLVAPVGAGVRVAEAGVTGARNLLFEQVGSRAAQLGAEGGMRPGVRAAIKGVGVPAAVLGGAAYLTGDSAPAADTPVAAPRAVDTAMRQGRAAPTVVTPREQLNAFISNVLGQGASINQVRALGDLVEGTPRPVSAKDAMTGQTALLSQQIFERQLAALQAQLADGSITQADFDAGVTGLQGQLFTRNAGLVGLNPAQLAQAQQLAALQEE